MFVMERITVASPNIAHREKSSSLRTGSLVLRQKISAPRQIGPRALLLMTDRFVLDLILVRARWPFKLGGGFPSPRWRCGGHMAARCIRTTRLPRAADRPVDEIPRRPEGGQANLVAIWQGLRSLGSIEGRNIQPEVRRALAVSDKARAFAKELVGMKLDVIVPSTNQVTEIRSALDARDIPILSCSARHPAPAVDSSKACRGMVGTSPVSPIFNFLHVAVAGDTRGSRRQISNVGFIHSPLAVRSNRVSPCRRSRRATTRREGVSASREQCRRHPAHRRPHSPPESDGGLIVVPRGKAPPLPRRISRADHWDGGP